VPGHLCMHLDIFTLGVATIFASALTGLLLLLAWLQDRGTIALALWGISFVMGSVAGGLLFARGRIPDTLSIDLANALLAAAYGLMWNAARAFDARPISRWVALAGAFIWLSACHVEAFHSSVTARVVLASAINGTYSFLTAFELWEGRWERLISRWPAIIFLLAHALILFTRALFAYMAPPTQDDLMQWSWTGISTVDSLFFVITLSFTLAMMAKERIQVHFQRVARIDPLTGVLNRGAFFMEGRRLMGRPATSDLPTAALIFDLDNFKQINDRYGHHAGDLALIKFCNTVTLQIGTDPVFGRLGGEEFGCLLPSTSLRSAMQIAENVRKAFEGTTIDLGAESFSVTVSIGAAINSQGSTDLDILLRAADRVLYRAKTGGRNRTEWEDVPSLGVALSPN
jgi:diguanylate cyclase (GGDEF)-like protein